MPKRAPKPSKSIKRTKKKQTVRTIRGSKPKVTATTPKRQSAKSSLADFIASQRIKS